VIVKQATTTGPPSNRKYDEEFVAKIGGDYPVQILAQDFVTILGGVGVGKIYYMELMRQAEAALAKATGSLQPIYPPKPGSKALAQFLTLFRGMGEGIGNSAVHETGHYLENQAVDEGFFSSGKAFPYMDCGLANHHMTPIGEIAGQKCENNDNFVYNFFNSIGTPPQDPNDPSSPGGDFFYHDRPGHTIHW